MNKLYMGNRTKREQINFRLDTELNEILQEKCEELGITKTEFVKQALRDALGIPTKNRPVAEEILSIQQRLNKIEQRLFES